MPHVEYFIDLLDKNVEVLTSAHIKKETKNRILESMMKVETMIRAT